MQITPLLTITEVSKTLKVHPRTIERLLKGQKIAGTKIGGVWRFTHESIEDYIKSRTLKIKKVA